jgi:signal transduction histidine kinase
MFSIALATPTQVSYKDLRPGFYRFNLNRLSLMGVPTDEEVSLGFEVLSPFWKTTWFWASTLCATLGIALAIWRFQISRQLKVENSRLAQQQVLEAERFRIARDIHDDFGARVTQISLLSSAAQKKQGLNPEAAADFEEVSQMSRDLVGALYETVWAISPENDHLDSLATYLFQMVSQMCAQAVLKCRLHMPDLPHEVPVTSTVRHNLVMTIKEALHNIIKHAQATEVQITLKYENEVLAIEVKDNGKGFDLSSARHGRGLDNMARRMAVLGGRRTQDSRPGGGTSVRIELCLPSNAGAAQQGRSEGQNL